VQYRTLKNGRGVSAFCLGAMNFGASTDKETSYAILDRFVEAGGTFIDTANNYGQWHGVPGASEELLGAWMRERGNRDQLTVATKVGARSTKPGDPGDEHWEGLGVAAIDAAVKGSLTRLGVDRIDLYYAHIDNRLTPLEETVGALGKLAKDGLVDLVGCSNTTTWRLERARQLAAAQGTEPYSVVQQRYTYLWPNPLAQGAVTRLGTPNFQHAGAEHLDYLDEHRDVTMVAYQPLLEGSYVRTDRPLPAQHGYAHPSAYVRFQTLREVAGEVGATANQVVLAWMLRHDPIVIPLFGVSTLSQLDEALEAVELELDSETMDRLSRA
jgi:aryl-alcohol dehydrogenase-like predicted oxidoreductase